jgi:hypothetical protein
MQLLQGLMRLHAACILSYSEPVMKNSFTLLVLAASLASAGPLMFSGNFATDDQVQLFDLTVAASSTITAQTTSYVTGGFDPYLSLFDGLGNLIATNDDGTCGQVGADPSTGNCFDSFLQQSLGAGSYTLALTEYYNVANGPTLGDGFSEEGQGDFTCPQGFCDSSPSQRTSAWALSISGVSSVVEEGQTTVPEPSTMAVAAIAFATLIIRRKK